MGYKKVEIEETSRSDHLIAYFHIEYLKRKQQQTKKTSKLFSCEIEWVKYKVLSRVDAIVDD